MNQTRQRSILVLCLRRVSTNGRLRNSPDIKQMRQIEVDEESVKQKLGQIQMDFVKKAEKDNRKRAAMHVKYRKKDWIVGGSCFATAIAIYVYTIYGMKQETFLDDFEMPDPLEEGERIN